MPYIWTPGVHCFSLSALSWSSAVLLRELAHFITSLPNAGVFCLWPLPVTHPVPGGDLWQYGSCSDTPAVSFFLSLASLPFSLIPAEPLAASVSPFLSGRNWFIPELCPTPSLECFFAPWSLPSHLPRLLLILLEGQFTSL